MSPFANTGVAATAHALLAALAVIGIVALLAAARLEWRHFARAGFGRAWWTLRLLMPLLFALGVAVAAWAARRALGSDGMILAYLGVLLLGLPAWFLGHVLVARCLRPAPGIGRALWLAASPLAAVMVLASVGQVLQVWAWMAAATFASGG